MSLSSLSLVAAFVIATVTSQTPVPTITTTPTTADPGITRPVLDPYCSFPNRTYVSCHVDAADPRSEVNWSFISRRGEVRRLGACRGTMGDCDTAVSGVTLTRSSSWSNLILTVGSAHADWSLGSLVCNVSLGGRHSSDECVLNDPGADFRDCTKGREACLALGVKEGKIGSINGRPVCCPPRDDNMGLSMDFSVAAHPCLCPKPFAVPESGAATTLASLTLLLAAIVGLMTLV